MLSLNWVKICYWRNSREGVTAVLYLSCLICRYSTLYGGFVFGFHWCSSFASDISRMCIFRSRINVISCGIARNVTLLITPPDTGPYDTNFPTICIILCVIHVHITLFLLGDLDFILFMRRMWNSYGVAPYSVISGQHWSAK